MSFLARAVRQSSRRGFLVRGDHGHHAQEVVPKTYRNGFLFGEKPLGVGEKRKRERWEVIWIVGMGGGFLLAAVGLYFKPDTSVEKWATEELQRRAAVAKGE